MQYHREAEGGIALRAQQTAASGLELESTKNAASEPRLTLQPGGLDI